MSAMFFRYGTGPEEGIIAIDAIQFMCWGTSDSLHVQLRNGDAYVVPALDASRLIDFLTAQERFC